MKNASVKYLKRFTILGVDKTPHRNRARKAKAECGRRPYWFYRSTMRKTSFNADYPALFARKKRDVDIHSVQSRRESAVGP